MDRAHTDLRAPITLESHALPPAIVGERTRRRGAGYQLVETSTEAVPRPNREARRRTLRATRRRLRPVATLLVGPTVLLLAGPAAATPLDPTTTTAATTTTTTIAVTTTVETTAPTTAAPTSTTTTTAAPATAAPTTQPAPAPTAPVPGSSARSVPTTGPTATSGPAATRPVGTVSATVVPSTTPEDTTTTTTVPGAAEAPPVGDVELPPETALDADPVAAAASGALAAHLEVVAGTRELTELGDEHTRLAAEVDRLEGRVADLTGQAFDLALAERPTAEVELQRVAAVTDLDAARTARAGAALRQALAATELEAASDRYPVERLRLATLVTARTGGDARVLNAVWANTPDPRLAVVYAALAQVGDPYVWAAAGPDSFDCSGLTGFAWRAAGVRLEHFTVTQRQTTLDVAEADLQAGDLVFNLDGPNGGHVGLYLGLDRLVVHAPAPGKTVSVTSYGATTGFGSPLADAPMLLEPVVAESAAAG